MAHPGQIGAVAPKDRLGRFALEMRLGRGAIGEVWAARHLDTGTPAAIKLVAPRWLGRADILEGFEHEVEMSAALSHPGIVPLLDHGRVQRDGVEIPWLAMELVHGGTLYEHRRRLDWRGVRRAVLDLLDALAYAHARGTVHRDVKPGNVLVDQGRVKLTDFGLAHRLGERLGEVGMVGTPSYMAPEQIRAEDGLGPWTDLYALACLTWTLLTGSPPFRGAGRLEVMAAHLEREPPPLQPLMEVPSALEDWLRWLLAKDPLDRPLLATDAAVALRSITPMHDALSTRRPPVPVTPRSPAHEWHRAHGSSALGRQRARTPSSGEHRGHRREVPPPLPHRGIVRASPAAFRVRHVRMVGREQERDRLWEALRQVISRGRPQCVVLEGPVGMGKSRLAQWLRERACELGVALPLRVHPDVGILEALRPYRRLVSSAHAMAAVSELCARRPVVLEIDDVERCPEILPLVEQLAQLEVPLLTVLVTQLEHRDASFDAIRARMPARRIHIDRLPPNRLRELASELLLVRGPVVDAIVERAGGSPSFVVELLRDWAERDLLVWTGEGLEPAPGARIELPANIRHVWEQRIERALRDRPEDDGVALELGALLGGTVSVREWLVACLTAEVEPSTDLLAEASRMGLLRLDAFRARRWSVAHGMIRDALRARALAAGRLATLHAACADALAAIAPEPRPPSLSARMGHHRLRAGQPHLAVDLLLAALEQPDHAVERRVVDLLAALEQAEVPEEDPRWGRAWNAAADAARLVGGHLDDIDWTELTIAAASAHGWIPELAGALARQALRLARTGEPEAAQEAARRASNFSQRLPPAAQLDVQSMVARVAAATGRHEEAMLLIERLSVRQAALGRHRDAGRLALELARLLLASGDVERADPWVDQARAWLEEAGAAADLAACDNLVAELARERGDLETAHRAWESVSRRRRPGLVAASSRLDLGRALTLLSANDFDAARELADAALMAVRPDRHPVPFAVARLVGAHAELDLGDASTALALLAEVEELVRETRACDGDLATAAASLAALSLDHGQLELHDRARALAEQQYAAFGRTELSGTPLGQPRRDSPSGRARVTSRLRPDPVGTDAS